MNIYLMPGEDSAYFAIRAEQKIGAAAVFLTKEGDYPTVAYHQRHDLNMCSILMREEIHNCDELIEYLKWNGECRNKILKLWDFDYDETDNREVLDLYAQCHSRKEEIYAEAMDDALIPPEGENSDEDCEDEEDGDGVFVDPSESENWPF